MKKTIFFVLLSFLGIANAFSQSINNVPLKDIENRFIQIIGTAQQSSAKATIEIDLGQTNKAFAGRELQVRDQNGFIIKFTSMMDALNFFSKNGYDLVETYVGNANNQNVYHYLLKRVR